MPQPASVPIYVQKPHLVSLTRVEAQSCGQPLPRYPVSGYERSCRDSDTRCRSGTKSGDFRSKCGKRPKRGKFELKRLVDGATGVLARRPGRRFQEGSVVAWSTSSTGMPSRTGYTRPHSVHARASGSTFRTSGFLHVGQTSISSRSLGIMVGNFTPGCSLLSEFWLFTKSWFSVG
jgi:hypothetical protein